MSMDPKVKARYLTTAITVACGAHWNQVDKGGEPYILHPLRLMTTILDRGDYWAAVVAVLHDVIEDADPGENLLSESGLLECLPDEAKNALNLITKKPGDRYLEDYIKNIAESGNDIAIKVKMADLSDNMRIERIPNPGPHDEARVDKYKKAWLILAQAKARGLKYE